MRYSPKVEGASEFLYNEWLAESVGGAAASSPIRIVPLAKWPRHILLALNCGCICVTSCMYCYSVFDMVF